MLYIYIYIYNYNYYYFFISFILNINIYLSLSRLSSSAFNSVRLWTIVVLCVLRLLLTRYHLQAYLNLAQKWVEQMRKEAGRIAAIDIQRKVGLKCGTKCGVTVYDKLTLYCNKYNDVMFLNSFMQVTRIFCYLTVVTLQYLIPILLVLFSTLALKSLGGSLHFYSLFNNSLYVNLTSKL